MSQTITESQHGAFGIKVGKAATGGVENGDFIYYDAVAGKATKATSAAGADKVLGLAVKDVDPTLNESFDDVVVSTHALVKKLADGVIAIGAKLKVGSDTEHVAAYVAGTDDPSLIIGVAMQAAAAAEDEIEIFFSTL